MKSEMMARNRGTWFHTLSYKGLQAIATFSIARRAQSPNMNLCKLNNSGCGVLQFTLFLNHQVVTGAVVDKQKQNKRGWLWPLGLVATGFAGAVVVILRGCWHGKMSWPVRSQEYSYQVCLDCGIKRLFDEKAFQAYGPYSYDLSRLISRERSRVTQLPLEPRPSEHRTAS